MAISKSDRTGSSSPSKSTARSTPKDKPSLGSVAKSVLSGGDNKSKTKSKSASGGPKESVMVDLSPEAKSIMQNEVDLQDSLQEAQDGKKSGLDSPDVAQAFKNEVEMHDVQAEAEAAKVDGTDATTTEEANPFGEASAGSTSMTVEAYDPATGKGTIDGMLKEQGYSDSEIYSPDAEGKTLIDRIAEVNELKNPNLIDVGQELTIPVKEVAEAQPAEGVEVDVMLEEMEFGTLHLAEMTPEQLSQLSDAELTGRALEGRELALAQKDTVIEAMGSLPEDMLVEAKRGGFYSIAEHSGIFANGDTRPTAEELRAARQEMTPEQVEAFEGAVFDWASDPRNQQATDTFWGHGVRDWAVSAIGQEGLSPEVFGAIEAIGYNGDAIVGNNQMSQEALLELTRRDATAGDALFKELNGFE